MKPMMKIPLQLVPPVTGKRTVAPRRRPALCQGLYARCRVNHVMAFLSQRLGRRSDRVTVGLQGLDVEDELAGETLRQKKVEARINELAVGNNLGRNWALPMSRSAGAGDTCCYTAEAIARRREIVELFARHQEDAWGGEMMCGR